MRSKKKIIIFVLILIILLIFILVLIYGQRAKDKLFRILGKSNLNFEMDKATSLTINKGKDFIFDKICYDKYLKIEISSKDVYKVTFLNSNNVESIIISTVMFDKSTRKRLLYKIPDYIYKKGYSKINIRPLYGDDRYYVSHFETIQHLDFEADEKLKQNIYESNQLSIKLDNEILLLNRSASQATIKHNGKTYAAEVTMSSTSNGTLKPEIQVLLNKEEIAGMDGFLLTDPVSNMGQGERLARELYSLKGGVASVYSYIDVFINNKYKGIYAIHKSLKKTITEKARNSVMLSIKNEVIQKSIEDKVKLSIKDISFNEYILENDIKNDEHNKYKNEILNKLNSFLENQSFADQVFNLDNLSLYLAILDIFELKSDSIYFLYDINSGKLESMMYREKHIKNSKFVINHGNYFYNLLLQNECFKKQYLDNVRSISYDINDYITMQINKSISSKYTFDKFNINYYKNKLKAIKNLYINKGIVCFYKQLQNNNIEINIINNNILPVSIKSIKYSSIKKPINNVMVNYQSTIIIKDIKRQNPNEPIYIEYSLSDLDDIYYQKAAEHKMSFYVAGHIYGSGQKNGTTEEAYVYAPFRKVLESFAYDDLIDFGILTGDMVLHANEESYNNLITSLNDTQKPYYASPGNHCLADGGSLFNKYFGKDYQSFVVENNLFIILTGRANWNIDDEQLLFIKNAIQNNTTVDNIFVFSHHLIWLNKHDPRFSGVIPNGWTNKHDISNFWSDVIPLFDKFNRNIYFIAGDVGKTLDVTSVVCKKIDNRYFIASGMGSGDNDNYLVIDVSSDGGVNVRLVSINGFGEKSLGVLEDYEIVN